MRYHGLKIMVCTLAAVMASAGCSPEPDIPTGEIGGSGGRGSGGAPLGGSSTGGLATGGTRQTTGGSLATGGVGTGGLPTGGATQTTGGTSTGGTASGGRATGGTSTGGTATGGTASGGRATGGTATGGRNTGGTGATGGDPPTGTVRVFYLRPSDVPFDQRYPDGIGNVMLDAQGFFQQQLGQTFRLNTPIVETVVGEHVRSWYENTANGSDNYWWAVFNMQQEIMRRFSLRNPDSRWLVVDEISAEGTGAGGGASLGWVLLPGHDADGAAGYPANTARWVGGMVHELGHAFGLPDSTSTDGTCLSASFYNWPNCTFTQSQKDGMLNGSYGSGRFLF